MMQVEGADIKERLSEQFAPEDSELLRSRLHSDSLNARSTHASQDSISFDEVNILPPFLVFLTPSKAQVVIILLMIPIPVQARLTYYQYGTRMVSIQILTWVCKDSLMLL